MAPERYRFGPFLLELPTRRLLRGTESVHLTPHEFELLRILVQNHDRVVEKRELMTTLWGDTCVEEGNLTQNVSLLRKVLGNQSDGTPYIETIPKQGYRLIAPVTLTRGRDWHLRTAWWVGMAVILAGAVYWVRPRAMQQRSADIPIVRVEPIKNVTGNSQLDSLCVRLTSELERVLARSTAVRLKANTHVDAWFTGDLEQDGTGLRVRLYMREKNRNTASWQYIFEFAADEETVALEHVRVAAAEAIAVVGR